METLEKQLVQAQEEYEEATKTAKRSNYICNELFTWADVYDTANHDERRAILHPTSGFGARHGLPKFFRHKKRRIVQNDARASPVDIPTGWNPRTKQQPTGLIAYPACGRAVLFESLWVPKPARDLYVRKRKAAALKLRCC